MKSITIETLISAPAERCFDVARDLHLHNDLLTFAAPLGILGVIAEKIALRRYLEHASASHQSSGRDVKTKKAHRSAPLSWK